MSKSIVQWDIDEATYIGDGDDGVYFQVCQRKTGKNKGWYVTTVVDSETGSFTQDLATDDGPYLTEQEAADAGRNAAKEWCSWNDVDYRTDEEKETDDQETE